MKILFSVVILSFMLILQGCPFATNSGRSAEEQFALNTDRAGEYTGRALQSVELLVDQKILTPERGTMMTDALLQFNSANKAVIIAGRKFIVEENGVRLLRFTEEGRLELERLAEASAAAATEVLRNPALLQIDPKARSQLIALIEPAQLAATRLVKLIKRAKTITPTNGSSIEIELSYGSSNTNFNFHYVRVATI